MAGTNQVARDPLPDVDLTYSRGVIALDGEPVLSYDDELPEAERSFIGKLLKAGYKARRGDCIPHVVAVYDDGEARAVDNFLKKHRAER